MKVHCDRGDHEAAAPAAGGDQSGFAWSIPFDTTETAVVRVRQIGGALADQSIGPFRLTSSLFAADPIFRQGMFEGG